MLFQTPEHEPLISGVEKKVQRIPDQCGRWGRCLERRGRLREPSVLKPGMPVPRRADTVGVQVSGGHRSGRVVPVLPLDAQVHARPVDDVQVVTEKLERSSRSAVRAVDFTQWTVSGIVTTARRLSAAPGTGRGLEGARPRYSSGSEGSEAGEGARPISMRPAPAKPGRGSQKVTTPRNRPDEGLGRSRGRPDLQDPPRRQRRLPPTALSARRARGRRRN